MTSPAIAPHGGRLIDRMAAGDERQAQKEKAMLLKRLSVGFREASDFLLLAVGAFSPLDGFLCSADYQRVLSDGRLTNGLPWTIPITLSVMRTVAEELRLDQKIALFTNEKRLLGTMEVRDIFPYDKEKEARQIYGTTDARHPGVRRLLESGDALLGGPITLLDFPAADPCYRDYLLNPFETRHLIRAKGWRTVVGFQTRNPIHRAHEYIQKCALETTDGLLIHPLVGETKEDDIPVAVRMECYRALVERYYPSGRVVLSVFPASMRYAGPCEAVFHALVRKNYGCTHFIVGRDHAGVSNFYGPYDARKIFERYSPEEIGIQPMFFDATFWCRGCGGMASLKTCPHDEEDRVVLSGTQVRQMLSRGENLPEEFTRPEVARILTSSLQLR